MLISDWQKAWQFLSVQFSAFGASALFAYVVMYDKMVKWLPPKYMMVLTIVVFVLVVLGRVTKQNIAVSPDSQ